jgi:hypothetical protein
MEATLKPMHDAISSRSGPFYLKTPKSKHYSERPAHPAVDHCPDSPLTAGFSEYCAFATVVHLENGDTGDIIFSD